MGPYLKIKHQNTLYKIKDFFINENIMFVSMSADATSTFEVNDINELSKFYKNIFLFPLIKDRFKKYKPPYKKILSYKKST